MPNTVTFVYDNGELYTFILDFDDGEDYGMLQTRFLNPLNWTGIWAGVGTKSLHFIDLKKVRHFYFQLLSEDELTKLKNKMENGLAPKLDILTGVALGVLTEAEEIKKYPMGARVRDIKKEEPDEDSIA